MTYGTNHPKGKKERGSLQHSGTVEAVFIRYAGERKMSGITILDRTEMI